MSSKASNTSNRPPARSVALVVSTEAVVISRAFNVHLPHPIVDLQRNRPVTLLAPQHPSIRALSPEAADIVLRKSQSRIRRKLRRAADR